MPPTIEKVSHPLWLGEAPHWSTETKSLYFVDILSKTVHRYDPATGKTHTAQLDEQVSIIVPVAGSKDKFVVSQGSRLVQLAWDGVGPVATIEKELAVTDNEPDKLRNSLNDGKADETGRLWAGSIALGTGNEAEILPKKGSLYSLSRDGNLTRHATDITLSNGLVWSLDSKTLYYIDSVLYRVDAFDCDIKKPSLSNRRVVFDLKANGLEGLPDGMTIDTDGNLWVATHGSPQVLNIDPRTGKLLRKVVMPVPQPTSVAFGGTNLDELYVTTANYKSTEEEKKAYPDLGATFRITGLGVKGLAGVSAEI